MHRSGSPAAETQRTGACFGRREPHPRHDPGRRHTRPKVRLQEQREKPRGSLGLRRNPLGALAARRFPCGSHLASTASSRVNDLRTVDGVSSFDSTPIQLPPSEDGFHRVPTSTIRRRLPPVAPEPGPPTDPKVCRSWTCLPHVPDPGRSQSPLGSCHRVRPEGRSHRLSDRPRGGGSDDEPRIRGVIPLGTTGTDLRPVRSRIRALATRRTGSCSEPKPTPPRGSGFRIAVRVSPTGDEGNLHPHGRPGDRFGTPGFRVPFIDFAMRDVWP